jgi:hypothetical protein
VDGLEVGELVVVGVDARAEEEPRVPPVDDLVVAELDEVGLVLLVARRYQAVDLVILDSLVNYCSHGHWKRRKGRRRGGEEEGRTGVFTSPLSLIFSSSL